MENNKRKRYISSKTQNLERTDLLQILNGAYIAERFFDRPEEWLSQKVNRSFKNGKRCKFNKKELKTVVTAIHTVASELVNLADNLQEEPEISENESVDNLEEWIKSIEVVQASCCMSMFSSSDNIDRYKFENERLRTIIQQQKDLIKYMDEHIRLLKNEIKEERYKATSTCSAENQQLHEQKIHKE